MRIDAARGIDVPAFSRQFFGVPERFTRIGSGPIGGKATGLLFMRDVIASLEPPSSIAITIPTLTVIAAGVFDRFIEDNRLDPVTTSGAPDDRLALAFQHASLPVEFLGDLRALVQQVRSPLAVRSSSLLEDALDEPFAGVYATKMIPNNQPDADTRFQRLVEAIKFVYASTFFADAIAYRAAMSRVARDDRMAVIIQEVVGRRHADRFYPDVSGVARSFSFYRSARARPEDGVVTLALGLGRTIVDEGVGWSYSPTHPAAPPPVASIRELAEVTQKAFWAVNMGPPPPYDPIRETEYLLRVDLEAAHADDTLRLVASTFDSGRDRLVPGDHGPGPRVLNFAPLLGLGLWPMNDAVRSLLASCERAVQAPVEIEFAATLDADAGTARIGFLQVRPMAATATRVEVTEDDLASPETVVASSSVMGNGCSSGIHDVVYVRPDRFETRHSATVAAEIAAMNAGLAAARVPYVLIGFGRWGSADPWLGLQVTWAQISGASAIVEATLPAFPVELSQGSHFFHNIASHGVSYFSVSADAGTIDWDWLARQPAVRETRYVRHVRCDTGLIVQVDGRTGRGIVRRAPE
jgi:Pyruvate phosphate dikinase, AMP/ATP-binding domain